jgi:diguanylate cyclase (GGDEF)-like protein/PAS domain S-box-containing protein
MDDIAAAAPPPAPGAPGPERQGPDPAVPAGEWQPGQLLELLDHVGDAVLVYDPSGTLLWASDALRRMFGVDPSEVVGTAFRLGDPATSEQAVAVITAAARGGEARAEVRLRVLDADGRSHWVQLTSQFVRDAAGTVAYAVATLHDVTEGIQAENRYRLMAENASDVVLEVGADRLFRWASSSVTRVLGWAPEDLVGHDGVEFLHPDDVDEVRASRDRMRGRDSVAAEFRWRCADGTYRWMSGSSRPIVDDGVAGGERVLVVNAIPDAVRHERRLADLDRARLRAVLDSELDPRVVLEAVRDDQGEIVDLVHVDVNRAACDWNGLPRHALVGTRLTDRFPAEMASTLIAQYAAVIETGEPLVLDEVLMRQDQLEGELHWFDVRAVRAADACTVSWRDVTERHAAAEILIQSEQRFRLLAENMRDVVMHVSDTGIRWVSPSLREVLGWRPERWVGQDHLSFVHPDDVGTVLADSGEAGGPRGRSVRLRLRDASGAFHWAQGQAGVYLDAHGEADGIIVSFRLADAEVAAEEVLRERAQHDDLTGLLNRSEMMQQLGELLARSRAEGSPTGTYVMFCDVDDFKAVNDTFGHAVGDDVLRIMGRRLRGAVRRDDLVARFGGDELLVVVQGLDDLVSAEALADKLRLRAAVPIVLSAAKVDVTMSIGLTPMVAGEDVDALVARADDAMYAAKRSGKNRVVTIPASEAPDA